jgi:hypothetical protein
VHRHRYARLAGHGIAVAALPPFAFVRHPGRGDDAVVVSHRPGGDVPKRLVLVPGAGGCAVERGAGTEEAGQVAEVGPGPATAAWSIETSAFSMAWPEGFAFQSSPAFDRAPGFDLVAPGDVLLWPQGPFPADGVPARDAMAAPDQRVVGEGDAGGARFVELAYAVEGTPWRMRHYVVPLDERRLVLTVQCPAVSAEAAFTAADTAAASVRAP